jgi:hypothetical protein
MFARKLVRVQSHSKYYELSLSSEPSGLRVAFFIFLRGESKEPFHVISPGSKIQGR